MSYINHLIKGVPYSRFKRRGRIEAPAAWSQLVIDQTRDLPKVREACILKVTFLLPEDKFPTDLPYGPDLDNLLKRLLDALNETIFLYARGHDSCVIALTVMKTKASSDVESGVHIEVLPVNVGQPVVD